MSNDELNLYSVVYASGLMTQIKARRRHFMDGTALRTFVALAKQHGTSVAYMIPIEYNVRDDVSERSGH